ncbi:hypothetical protein [Streptomyces sp. NPDC059814]|uniref:hypothetical protein n=1 Tax=Streptomyces sp. NPDC059814 TaxID=3346959 RepID=UPI00364CD745
MATEPPTNPTPPLLAPPAPPSPWRDADFRRLWVGQIASRFGAQAGQVVLPLVAVVSLDAEAGQLGALRAVEQAPLLLVSLFVGGNSSLRAVGLASALCQFSFAALMTVYLFHLPRGLRPPGTAVGLALAATGPGAVVGSLPAVWLPGRFRFGPVLVAPAVLADAVMLCVPALRGSPAVTLPALMGINFLFGTFSQLVNVTTTAVRQAVTPLRVQGRVVATINFAGLRLTPLGSLLGGLLTVQWGLRTSLLLTAAVALSPLFMALSPPTRLGTSLPDEHRPTGGRRGVDRMDRAARGRPDQAEHT